MSDGPVELYLKYRPKNLNDVIGQPEVVSKLKEMGRSGRMPHFLAFTGPSGCGKTTVARIIAEKLHCDGSDFEEINAADARGIDMVRALVQNYQLMPLSGPCRIFMMDEAHALTAAAQDLLLKPLEEPPQHAYFFFCTTNFENLKTTVRTRATEFKFNALTEKDLSALAIDIAGKEGKTLSQEVADRIGEAADGSARTALVILHSVIGLPDKAEQLKAIELSDAKGNGFQLAQLIFKKGKADWSQIATLLQAIQAAKEEPEKVRQTVLSYARTILLKSCDPFAALVIEEFRDNFFYTHHPGLAVATYNVFQSKK